MKKIKTYIEDLFIIEPIVYEDERGFFFESYNEKEFKEMGIDLRWVQDNHSKSVKNTVRGMHYQRGIGQTKLVRCIQGTILDAVVDIRYSSPTYGAWFTVTLSAENKRMLFIPSGFAHGFAVISDTAEIAYKCDRLYDSELEDGFRWNDSDVGIEWGIENPILSERDKNARGFNDL